MRVEPHIKILQAYLKEELGNNITVDGLIGPETRATLRRFLYRQFERRGWTLEHVRNNPTELVWFRYDKSYNNTFNDYCIVMSYGDVSHVLRATTTPGNYWIYNPVTVGGITGVATLCEQQVIGSHRWVENNNWKTLWLGMPYAQQVGELTIFRDGNKDNVFDRNVVKKAKNTGINFHQMGAGTVNWNWSAGCMGTSKEDWLIIVNRFDNSNMLNLNLLER